MDDISIYVFREYIGVDPRIYLPVDMDMNITFNIADCYMPVDYINITETNVKIFVTNPLYRQVIIHNMVQSGHFELVADHTVHHFKYNNNIHTIYKYDRIIFKSLINVDILPTA